MARNGSGTAAKAVSDFVAGNNISASDMNTLIDDIIDMLTQSISKDGQTTISDGLVFDGANVTSGNMLGLTNSGATFSGRILYAYSNSVSTSSHNLVEVVNDNTAATGAVCLRIQQDSTDYALDISDTASSGVAVRVVGASTGGTVSIQNDALTDGTLLYLYSDSSSTTARYLTHIVQTNASATEAIGLRILQDSTAAAIRLDKGTTDGGFMDFRATADGDATSAISTLTTSGSTTHHIQVEINGTKAWIAASTNAPS